MQRLITLAFCLGSSFLAAEDDLSAHKLTDWNLGENIQGEDYTHEDLEGKVVVIEYWGVNCGPCIAAMPHLADLDKRNRKKGLRIIASESQNSSNEDILELTEDNKVKYTITRGTRGPVNSNGIPHALIFDVTGQLIYSGHPSDDDFERTVKKSLREVSQEDEKRTLTPAATPPLIAQRNWTNQEGQTIVAAAVVVAGDFVTFKMQNGREVAYPISKLSEQDQALLKESAEDA